MLSSWVVIGDIKLECILPFIYTCFVQGIARNKSFYPCCPEKLCMAYKICSNFSVLIQNIFKRVHNGSNLICMMILWRTTVFWLIYVNDQVEICLR